MLETIQVQKQQCEAPPMFPGAFQRLLDQVIETDAVRRLRERDPAAPGCESVLRELRSCDVARW